MVNITIDGKQFEVKEGTTVLNAAREAGIDIPTLCDHPSLTPYGGCRLCVVEVDGMRTLQPSCTLPVNNNMVVRTNTEKTKAARKFVLTLLFSERNHLCSFCVVSGGDCELQNSAYAEGMTHWPIQPTWQKYAVDSSHEFMVLEHNRCILCRRCVRACAELVGNFTLGFEERGSRSSLIADLGTPLGESSCISCGTCVQICPTGAIIDRWSAYRGSVENVDKTSTICLGCSVGCGIEVFTKDNNLLRIEGNWDGAVNHGVICKLGRFHPMQENRQRVLTPMIRKNGSLKAATWDEALDAAAHTLKPMVGQASSGVAALASTRLSAEALNAFKQVFADGFHSSMVTSIEEGAPTATTAQLADELKIPFEGDLNGLLGSDCIVAIGVNLIDSHEVPGFFIKRIHADGTKLITIDPSSNPMDVLSDHVLKGNKGSDLDLIEGLLAALYKLKFVESSAPFDVEKILAKAVNSTGISEKEILATAATIGQSKNAYFVYGKGITRNNDNRSLKALLDLAASMNRGESRNVLSVKGQANSVAASLYSLDKTFAMNGHKAAYIAIADDEPSERLIEKLEKSPFTIVQSSYVSKLTAKADIVFPVENWLESEGHYMNLEGRLQKANKSLQGEENIKSNVEVLKQLADRVGLNLAENWEAELTKRTPITQAQK